MNDEELNKRLKSIEEKIDRIPTNTHTPVILWIMFIVFAFHGCSFK